MTGKSYLRNSRRWWNIEGSHDWKVLSKEIAPLVEHRGVP